MKKNFFYNILYQVFAIALPLIVAPYITRVLGAEKSGIYSYSQAFANYFYLFAMLGVNNYGNREIAKVQNDKRQMSVVFWEIYSLQAFLSLLFTTIYLITCIIAIKQYRNIYLIQVLYVISSGLDINWACFGMEKFKLTSIRSTVVKIVSTMSIFCFVNSSNDLIPYTFILSLTYVVSALSVWPFVLHTISFQKPKLSHIIRHIKPNLYLFLPVISVSIYNIMDKLMLGWWCSKSEIAYYEYAEKIVLVPCVIVLAIENVAMPKLTNLVSNGKNGKYRLYFDMVFCACSWLSVGMSWGIASVGQAFAPLFYGEDFLRCGLFMVVLAPVIVFRGWASGIRTMYIIPNEKDRIYLISIAIGALVNCLINVVLIPKMAGIGAIIGTIAAEFTVFVIQMFMSVKEINIKKQVKDAIYFSLAGLIMYSVLKVINFVWISALVLLILKVIIGAVVYVAFSILYFMVAKENKELYKEIGLCKNGMYE